MRYFNTILFLLGLVCFVANTDSLYAQQAAAPKDAMVVGVRNYKSFTTAVTNRSAEAIKNNKGYEQHPEMGKLFAEAPCTNCYELIGKRTEASKTFIKEETDGKNIMQQTSSAPMHYRDAKGNWATIKTQLQPSPTTKGIYAATEQELPVSINSISKTVSLGVAGQNIQFNNNLELVFEKADGTQTSLGSANWTNHTAGDDGVYVTNAWPGMDIEIFVIRGSVKTNFWITKAMPAYAGGKLLVRDHLKMSDGLTLYAQGAQHYTGNLEVRNAGGENAFTISAATAFERNNIEGTLQMLEYYINGNVLDIALPGNFLNRPASAYPVIIDPLVSGATPSTVTGSTYSSPKTAGCVYTNPATVPAKVTITDIQYSFQYVTSGGALLRDGAFDFKLSGCRSPTPTALFWNCNSLLTGTCTGSGASMFTSLSGCMPGPQCLPYNLNLTMNFYQEYMSTTPCSSLYITAGTPLTITVFGNTIDAGTVSATATPVCQGKPTTLSMTASDGVPPYTYTWMPGAATGATVTITPTVTTTYTVTVTDACGSTATATKAITVNPIFPIAGILSVCTGGTTGLSNAVTGGTWMSGNTTIATIGSTSGIAAGLTAGTTTITYTNTSGCPSTATLTVLAPPASITGVKSICQGSTTALSNGATGGTWTSNNTTIATVAVGTGIVTGTGGGTVVITYTAPAGCAALATVTVFPLSAITGSLFVCMGGSTNLNNTGGAGTWTSTNTTVATVGSSTGKAAGIAPGTTSITYTSPAGCVATAMITITTLPPITGVSRICQGAKTTLTNAAGGGTWTTVHPSVSTISSLGVVTGTGGGTDTIVYTTAGGCYATITVTVDPTSPITGPTFMCTGDTATMSNMLSGGTWISSNTLSATINTSTGKITATGSGTTVVTYTTIAGCATTTTVTVTTALPITGITTICQGTTSTLSNANPGGTWGSSNTAIASAGGATGTITGINSGTATISYNLPSGCNSYINVTVLPAAPISGPTTVCAGSTIALSDATPGGTWSSSNTGVATINISGVVTAVAGGATIIRYTTSIGCIRSLTVTVNPISPITGAKNICQGLTSALTNVITGGTWSSSATTVATINTTTGILNGVTAGTSVITYTTAVGCQATVTVTVNLLSPITGTAKICQGLTTLLSNALGGGTWSSSNTAVATVSTSGSVTATAAGTIAIQYITPAGCIATMTFTVNPSSPIAGATSICQITTTTLSNAVAGGTWSSSNTTVASINSAGTAAGISGGTSNITYTTVAGCVSTITLTINPRAAIIGATTLCQSYTSTLSNAVAGGTWSSSNTTIATVDAAGLLTAIANGSCTVQYMTPTGCISTTTVTVNPLASITGVLAFCTTSTLSDATPGGTWSSNNTTIATVGASTGLVTGVSPGMAIISYTTSGGCFTTATVTIYTNLPITGVPSICSGTSTTFSNALTGGTWSTGSTAVATIGMTSGTVTGVGSGSVLISYTNATGCISVYSLFISPQAPIMGTTLICQGSTAALSNAVPGGTWSSSNTTVATIVFTSGIASGISAGTSTITYTTAAGCSAIATVSVYPTTAIAGSSSICNGSLTSFSNATPGGAWSSSNTTVATIDPATGIATPTAAGTTNIRYTTPAGCFVTLPFTINAIFPISGPATVCQGGSITLTNGATGGTWTSSNTTIAPIGNTTGIVNGVNAGTTTITYTTAAGCTAGTTVTVFPLAAITGVSVICAGSTTTFSNATPGGSWSSTNTTVSTIDPTTGVATGTIAGTTTISYTTSAGCVATATLTVNAFPSAIGGNKNICLGQTTTLTNALGGGTWSSNNIGVAGISSGGVATGVSVNTTTITYTVPGGCFVTTAVTVNPLPSPIAGVTNICVGATATLTNATPGGTWSSSNTAVVTINSAGVVAGVTAGAAIISYTSLSGCSATIIVTIFSLPAPITGTKTVCEGGSSVLLNTLGGGTWSSSNTTVAAINTTTGVFGGMSAGSATITYQTPAGCFATTAVQVNVTPVISGLTFTHPTTCINNDGTITLAGLAASAIYAANYNDGVTPVTVTLASNSAGQIIITGLGAGTYSNFSVTTSLGCASNVIGGPVVLLLPPTPAMPTASNNTPICDGSALKFAATDATSGVTYFWTGPGGYTSTLQNPMIDPASVAASGTYSVVATKLGCVSGMAMTTAVVHNIPSIINITYTNPKTCQGTDGTITLEGLIAGNLYALSYMFNLAPVTVNITADAAGKVILKDLVAGFYANISILFSCSSNTVGPISLSDPLPVPVPKLESNSPLCTGKRLQIITPNVMKELTYEWTGPNGFTSNLPNPEIPAVTMADSGLYSLTIRYLNCPSYATHNVIVYPPTKLTDVTASQTIPLGSSLQLGAGGAQFYMWSPNNGTLNNPGIDSPIVTPTESATYSVVGFNRWGCRDSADVAITVDDNIIEVVPNAFTPNNDGKDDIFRIMNMQYSKLVQFSIYNRWGQVIYHNTTDPAEGWDGTYKGVPQDMGTYSYSIILATPAGKNKILKGDVVLIR